ncbi:MAG: PPOX class F420-dependent oxidoreductase [Caldilineaceae bacterium]|nr:PPOX class F420-dependent oxidoreductase [Caldilineaceae bacterium]
MQFKEIGNPTYIALETFRKSGEGVVTPVWVVAEGGKLYVWTVGDSGKVKRIRNNGRVHIAVSDSRGTPKSEWVEATARVLDTRRRRGKAAQTTGEQVWLAVSHVQFHEPVFAQQGGTCGDRNRPGRIGSGQSKSRLPAATWLEL